MIRLPQDRNALLETVQCLASQVAMKALDSSTTNNSYANKFNASTPPMQRIINPEFFTIAPPLHVFEDEVRVGS